MEKKGLREEKNINELENLAKHHVPEDFRGITREKTQKKNIKKRVERWGLHEKGRSKKAAGLGGGEVRGVSLHGGNKRRVRVGGDF